MGYQNRQPITDHLRSRSDKLMMNGPTPGMIHVLYHSQKKLYSDPIGTGDEWDKRWSKPTYMRYQRGLTVSK